MHLKINHTTQYNYAAPAAYALQQLRVRPVDAQNQKIVEWKLELDGASIQTDFFDQHGNFVDLVEFLPDAKEISVTVSGEVETYDTSGVAGPHTLLMPLWFYLRQTSLTKPGKLVMKLVADMKSVAAEKDDVMRLHQLSELILQTVKYETGGTDVKTTAEDALERGSGVCQDHTHIFLSAARVMGYPTRYVSGYLMMNDRVNQEASHAWAEAHIDGLGWVGFDVSNSISPDERYVTIARGLDYRECAPTTGFIRGGQQENLFVTLQVQQ